MSKNGKITENKNFGKDIFDKYLDLLKSGCSDFNELNSRYRKLCKHLEKIYPYTNELIEEYENTFVFSVLHSFEQGLNDNLEHFKNPQIKTCADIEYESLEKAIYSSDDYSQSHKIIDRLVELMQPEALEIYYGMTEYFIFLETYLPKMAHYYGYMDGNVTLKKIMPEYTEDNVLNQSYKEWLSEYLGLDL